MKPSSRPAIFRPSFRRSASDIITDGKSPLGILAIAKMDETGENMIRDALGIFFGDENR